jgi:predicted small secreted protein
MLRWITTAALGAFLMTFTACNTVHGFGKDMEQGGQKIQEKTGKNAQEWSFRSRIKTAGLHGKTGGCFMRQMYCVSAWSSCTDSLIPCDSAVGQASAHGNWERRIIRHCPYPV